MKTKVLVDQDGNPIESPDNVRFPRPIFGGYGEDGSHLRIVHSVDEIRQMARESAERLTKALSQSKERLDQANKESIKKMEG